MIKYLVICTCSAMLFAYQASFVRAEGVIGVEIEEVVTLSSGGEELRLRGAAVRNSARQAVYVGGLYLQDDSDMDVKQILASNSPKRFVLYCQDSTIKPDALIRALNLGIVVNHTEKEISVLAPMIKQFNDIWKSEIKEGDKVWVDYIPEKGTFVSVNGIEKGVIAGKVFYSAFLKSWLGEKPLSQTMKDQLLGKK